MKLFMEDCITAMSKIDDGSVDLVLCDPPYGTTACSWDAVIPFDEMWQNLLRVSSKSAVFAFTASQPFTSALVMSNVKMFKCEWIWQKNAGSNFGVLKYQPMKEHESVVVFAHPKSTYNPIMQERSGGGLARVQTVVNYETKTDHHTMNSKVSSKRPDLRYPSSVQKFNRERGLHPTQKPVDLMEYLIRTYSNLNQTVLDFTMGSGTTGVAAMNTGRDFIGIENDPDYFKIAKDRIEESHNWY